MGKYGTTKTLLHSDPCQCSVFFLPQSESSRRELLENLKSPNFLDFNPTLIILINSFFQEENGKSLQIILATSQFVHVTSNWLLITGKNISLLCFHCSSQTTTKIESIEENIVQEVAQIWRKLTRNLSHVTFMTRRPQLKYLEGRFPPNCEEYGDKRFLGDERLCMVALLAEQLKFKLTFDPFLAKFKNFSKTVTSMGFSSSSSPRVILELENWQVISLLKDYSSLPQTRHFWMSHGWMNDPLKFLLFLDKNTLNNSALLRPYDAVTWLLLGISVQFVSLILTMSYVTWRKSHDLCNTRIEYMSTLIHIHLMVLGSLFEQNPNERTAKKVITSFRILFGVWLLVSLILSNGYNGIVISFLCSAILPSDLPSRFESLAKVLSTYPVVTSDQIYITTQNKSVHYSEALIYEYLHAEKDGQVKNYYKKIVQATVYVRDVSRSKFLLALEQEILLPRLVGVISLIHILLS